MSNDLELGDAPILFGRAFSLTIGNLEVSHLRCQFRVKKTLKPEPNTCDLTIYNLNDKHRLTLQTIKNPTVRLEAGYGSSLFQLFLGRVKALQSVTDGTENILQLSSGDSAKEMQTARINNTIGPKAPVETAIRSIAKALGVGIGNVDQVVALLTSKGVATIYPAGKVLSGNAARLLTDFCRSAGLEWSVQDGKLQILDIGKASAGLAIELSSASGLIGSPTVDIKGIASFESLLIPGLVPGAKVSFKAKHLQGGYRILSVEYIGDTHGDDWSVRGHAKRY